MVASFLQRCFGCRPGVQEAKHFAGDVAEDSVPNHRHADRGQIEELLTTLREPLLSLEGSWFARMRRLLDVLQERASLHATLISVIRNGPSSATEPQCYVLLEGASSKSEEFGPPGQSLTDREAALVVLQACTSKRAVPATPSRPAACVPLLHAGAAVGALWLTVVVDTSNPRTPATGKSRTAAPAPLCTGGGTTTTTTTAAAGGVAASALASCGSVAGSSRWPSYSGAPTAAATAAFAAALLSSAPSLDALAFTVSVAVQGADPDQLPWLAAAAHRLVAAASLHALSGELCDCVAAHVQRRFVLEAAVKAVLVPGDSAAAAAGASDACGGGGGMGFLLGTASNFGAAAATNSPLPHSAASSRCGTRAQHGNGGGSTNGAVAADAANCGGFGNDAVVAAAAEGLQGSFARQGSFAAGINRIELSRPRRLSQLGAAFQSEAAPRNSSGQAKASTLNPAPQAHVQPPPVGGLRANLSLQQLQGSITGATGPGPGPGSGPGRGLGSLLGRRPHSLRCVTNVGDATGAGGGGGTAAPMIPGGDLALSRRTLSGTTPTRPLVVALPLTPDAVGGGGAAAAGWSGVRTGADASGAAAKLSAADTRASKSANAGTTCLNNINSFLAAAGCGAAPASALLSSWQGGILPPPAATVTAHTFALQHTLLHACSAAAMGARSSTRFGGSGGGAAAAAALASSAPASAEGSDGLMQPHPAVVEDCCSLLQDVHRPARDVCLLMGLMSQPQQLQLSTSTPLPGGPPLQRTSSQSQLLLPGGGAGGAAALLLRGATGGPAAAGSCASHRAGVAGASAGSTLRGSAGTGQVGGLRSLALVLVSIAQAAASPPPPPPLAAAAVSAGAEGPRSTVTGASSSGPGLAPAASAAAAGGYLGLYVCFSARLPRPLLEAVRNSCQELIDEALGRIVAGRLCGDLAAELGVYKSAAPGSYAVLRGQELTPDDGPAPSAPSTAAAGSPGGRATPSRRRGTQAAGQPSAGIMSLFGRAATAPPATPLSGGGTAAGPATAAAGTNRQISSVISGTLLNAESDIAGPVMLAARAGAGARTPGGSATGPRAGPVWQQQQHRTAIPQFLVRSFKSMRAKDTTAEPGGATLSLERILRSYNHPQTNNHTLAHQLAPRDSLGAKSPRATGPSPLLAAAAAAAATAAEAEVATEADGDGEDRDEPTVAVNAGAAAAADALPNILLSTGTTNVEDLLNSLLECVPPLRSSNTQLQQGAAAADAGGGGGGQGGWLWHCDSILHVTAEDARDTARQQMDMLVSSVTATGAEAAAAARRGAGYSDDLAHLELREVLGRGGGGVVLRGKSGTTDVAVKLMEMPIPLEGTQQMAGQQQNQGGNGDVGVAGGRGGGSADNGNGNGMQAHAAGRDRVLLRNRRTMLRHAMELWCGTVLSHPNIVQVYTTFNSVVLKMRKGPDGGRQFYLQAVPDSRKHQNQQQQRQQQQPEAAATTGQGTMAAGKDVDIKDKREGDKDNEEGEALEPSESICTAILVEWCDRGSLAAALYARTFPRVVQRQYDDVFRAMPYDMKDVYLTLLDVALALRHLHSLHLVHRDLKTANLLLKSNPSDPRGFTVKLADFGFVLQMNEVDPDGTHYAIVDQPAGTVTHMPPEALSKHTRLDASADVYGFGVIMWELLAGGLRPYSQLPVDRIPRLVVKGGRPVFPDNVPLSYRRLAAACWSSLPAKRPRAAELVAAVSAELAALI